MEIIETISLDIPAGAVGAVVGRVNGAGSSQIDAGRNDCQGVAQRYHESPQFTADMRGAFKKAAEQAQIENAQIEETP